MNATKLVRKMMLGVAMLSCCTVTAGCKLSAKLPQILTAAGQIAGIIQPLVNGGTAAPATGTAAAPGTTATPATTATGTATGAQTNPGALSGDQSTAGAVAPATTAAVTTAPAGTFGPAGTAGFTIPALNAR